MRLHATGGQRGFARVVLGALIIACALLRSAAAAPGPLSPDEAHPGRLPASPPAAAHSTASPASEPGELTLGFVLARAREADLRFALSVLEERLASLRAREALGRALPSLSLGATLTRNAKEIRVGEGSSERVVTPLWLPLGTIVTRVPLVRGEEFAAAYGSALDADAVAHEEGEARKALLAEVAETFLGLAEEQERIAALREAEVAAESLWVLAGVRVRAGSAVPLDVDLADAERLWARAERVIAEGRAAQAELALSQVLDLPLGVHRRAGCDACIPPPAADPAAGGEALARGDLLALRLRVDAARARRFGQWMTWLPTLEAVANVRLGQPTLFNPEWVFWNAQLQLSWDLFAGTARGFATAAAAAQVARGELALSLAEREARLARASAEDAWRAAGLVRDASEARARVAARAREVAAARYREGLLSMGEQTRAARSEVEARLDLIRARFQMERAALRWRLAMGREPLEEGAR